MNVRKTLLLAVRRFLAVGGGHRAAPFCYYALFSLPSLLVLFVTIGSFFVDRSLAARAVVSYVENYLPLETAGRDRIFSAIVDAVSVRAPVGAIALVLLVWSAIQFFNALIRAVNRAWNTRPLDWWHQPLRGLALLGVMVGAFVVGIGVPLVANFIGSLVRPSPGQNPAGFVALTLVLPLLIEFYGLSLFYRLALRRQTSFSEVWFAALLVTAALRFLQWLFVVYVANFGHMNAVYGAFGAVIVLLLWTYVAGWVVIMGSCLSAAQAEVSRGSAR